MSSLDRGSVTEWHAERRARRLQLIRSKRPIRLRAAGSLRPDVAAWGQALLDGTAGNLILAGDIGTGKSWHAWEVLERAVAAGYADRVIVASSAEWRDTIAPPVDRERLRLMRECGVLVLDDLGSGRVGDWELECLLSVIDERWANDLPIIVTSNVPSLRKMLGERLASRIAHGATVVKFEGKDQRRAS